MGFNVGVIQVRVKPQIKHPVRSVHHIELTTSIMGSAHIDWPKIRDHPAIMFLIRRIRYRIDFVLFAFVITCQTYGAEIIPIFRPTRLQIMGEDLLQLGITRGV
jgi:hypothetical protein